MGSAAQVSGLRRRHFSCSDGMALQSVARARGGQQIRGFASAGAIICTID